MQTIKHFINTHKHMWWGLYLPVYLIMFFTIEHLSLFFNKFRAGRLRKRVRVYYTVFICHILRRSTVCCCIGKTKKTAGWY